MSSKFVIGERVVVDENDEMYVGTVTKVFPLGTANSFPYDSELELEVAVRDNGQSRYGYQVEWEHNGRTNPWSEAELESYIINWGPGEAFTDPKLLNI